MKNNHRYLQEKWIRPTWWSLLNKRRGRECDGFGTAVDRHAHEVNAYYHRVDKYRAL